MFRALGFAGLLILGFLYRGGENGSHGLQPKWWGILGLIGWAYLFSCMIYQLMRGNLLLLIVSVALCMAWYAMSRADFAKDIAVFQWMAARAGHAAHTGIVLSGVVLSLLFFDHKLNLPTRPRFVWVFVFAIAAAIAAYAIRPYYPISKIYATPSWCLYCVAACTILYMLLYWLTDVLKYDRWTSFFKPAASNALLVYILPAIIMYFLVLTGLRLTPAIFHTGMTGVIWSLCFAVFIMVLAMGLNKLKIKLQL
jgi:predicted acyltransferase